MKSLVYILPCWLLGAALLVTCSNDTPSGTPLDDSLSPPSSLSATYDGDRILLTWSPTEGAELYRIYRTTAEGTDCLPDTSHWGEEGTRAQVPADSTSYSDTPGLSRGVYHYGIRAGRVAGDDTLLSALHPPYPDLAACTLSVPLSFTMNGGRDYVYDDLCTLTIEDPLGVLDSVRFTQTYERFWDSSGTLIPVQDEVPREYEGDTYNQIRDLTRPVYSFGRSWRTADYPYSALPHREEIQRPIFGAMDPWNQKTSYVVGGDAVQSFLWRLRPGLDGKVVFAELFANGVSAPTDTMSAEATAWLRSAFPPQPAFSEDIGFYHVPAGTMDDGTVFYTVESCMFRSRPIRFKAPVTHSECGKRFECWILIGERYPTMEPEDFRRKPWLMTRPVSFELVCDTSHVYELPLDTTSALGRQALSRLMLGKDTVVHAVLDASLATNRDTVDHLSESYLRDDGAKQFQLALRFFSDAFSDTMTFLGMYRRTEPTGGYRYVESRIDWFPPLVHMDTSDSNASHLGDGDTIEGVFDFALAAESLHDPGHAQIERVSLLIAAKPDGMIWNPATTPQSLSPASLSGDIVGVFPLLIDTPADTLRGLRWDTIDPGAWPPGEYLMGIVACDNAGNEGFALVHEKLSTNPWLVRYEP